MEKNHMIRLAAAVVLGISGFGSVGAQTVVSKTVAGQVYVSSEFVVNARPESVIMWLTNPNTLAGIMGYEFSGGVKRFFKIGDAIKITPLHTAFGQRDTGVILLSYVRASKEIRFTFEPENGKYIYQDQWEPLPFAGNQTKIHYCERSIDSDGAQSSSKTEECERLMRERLTKLKAIVERK
jgi:hypothetical protein